MLQDYNCYIVEISAIKINFLFNLLYSFMESEENIVLLMSFLSFHRSTLSLTVIFSNIKTTRDFLFDYFPPLSGKTPPLCLLSFPSFLTLINISLIGCKTWSPHSVILSLYLILTFYDEVGVFTGIKSDLGEQEWEVWREEIMSSSSPLLTPPQPPPGLADKCGNKSKAGPGPQLPMSFIIGGELGNR